MHPKSNPVETDPVAALERHWESGSYSHAAGLAARLEGTTELILERLPNGEHAYLRPTIATPVDRYRLDPDRVVIVDQVPAEPMPTIVGTAQFIPRDQLPRFIVRTQTVYMVHAPTAERALRWFADPNDIDLDVEPLDFGEVEVFGQLAPEDQIDDEPRYWITNQGRRALAAAALFDPSPTVAEARR